MTTIKDDFIVRFRRSAPAVVAALLVGVYFLSDELSQGGDPIGWRVFSYALVLTGGAGILTGLAAGLWARQRAILDISLSVCLALGLSLVVHFAIVVMHGVGCSLDDVETDCYVPTSDQVFALLAVEAGVLLHPFVAWIVDQVRSGSRSKAKELPA